MKNAALILLALTFIFFLNLNCSTDESDDDYDSDDDSKSDDDAAGDDDAIDYSDAEIICDDDDDEKIFVTCPGDDDDGDDDDYEGKRTVADVSYPFKIEELEDGPCDYPALAVDSKGAAHITYQRGTGLEGEQGDLVYATNLSGVWNFETLDVNTFRGYKFSSVAIDSADAVHVIFTHSGKESSQDRLMYGTNRTGTWVFETVETGRDAGYYSHLVLDKNDKAHLVYSEIVQSDYYLKYASNSSGEWKTLLLQGVEDECYNAEDTSLAIDGEGNLHLLNSYCSGRLYYWTTVSGDWVCKKLISAPGDIMGRANAVATSDQNQVHIVYDACDWFFYREKKDGTWQEPIQFADEGSVWSSSLSTDSDDNAHLFYTYVWQPASNAMLRYGTNQSGKWQIGDVEQGVGRNIAGTVDSSGSPHVAYTIEAMKLKYAKLPSADDDDDASDDDSEVDDDSFDDDDEDSGCCG